jgi:hypothetical protein
VHVCYVEPKSSQPWYFKYIDFRGITSCELLTASLCTNIQMLNSVVSQEECQSKEKQGGEEGEEDIYSIPSTSTTQQGIPLPSGSSVSI